MSGDVLPGIGDVAGRAMQPSRHGDLRLGAQPPATTAAEVQRILAAGRRKLPAPDLLRIHSAHARSLRAAFMEGLEIGSRGFLGRDDPEARHLWARSRANRQLNGGEPACHLIGWKATCADPAAAGITVWTILAVLRERTWIGAHGLDLIVQTATVRLLTGEPVLGAAAPA